MAVRRRYLEGQEVTGSMRAVTIDWLMQVQREFKLREETMFMTINIVDCFLQVCSFQNSPPLNVAIMSFDCL